MQRSVLRVAVVVIVCGLCLIARADDTADARKAFDNFVQYTHTADDRTTDLFAPDIIATFYFDAGQGIREMSVSGDTFREMVRKGQAKRDGNLDKYEEIECKQDGSTVKLTCMRIDGKTGERTPFTLVYDKDGSGTLKIKAMRMKVPPPKVTPGS